MTQFILFRNKIFEYSIPRRPLPLKPPLPPRSDRVRNLQQQQQQQQPKPLRKTDSFEGHEEAVASLVQAVQENRTKGGQGKSKAAKKGE